MDRLRDEARERRELQNKLHSAMTLFQEPHWLKQCKQHLADAAAGKHTLQRCGELLYNASSLISRYMQDALLQLDYAGREDHAAALKTEEEEEEKKERLMEALEKEEEERQAAEKKAAKAAKRAAKGKGWRGLLLKAKKVGQTVLDKALDQPLAAGGTLLVLIVTLLMTRKKKAVVEEDDAEEEEEEEEEESEEEEEPAPRRGRRRTPKAD